MKKKLNPLKPLIFWTVYLCVIAVTVVIDQLSKHFVEIAVAEHGRIRVIGDWLTLTWTLNDGATGGIMQNLPWRNVLFFVMTLIGLPVFGYMLWRSRTRSAWGQVAFAFMIGGTIGNAIDRMFLVKEGGKFFSGAVRDFVQVQNFFGIFNMADSFLVAGVILALLAVVVFDYDGLVAAIIDERGSKTVSAEKIKSDNNLIANADVPKTDSNAKESVAEDKATVRHTSGSAEKTDEDS